MILVQAVVVAEALRRQPKPEVLAWLDSHVIETLYLAAPCAALLMREISELAAWQRQPERGPPTIDRVLALFEHRILPFDGVALRAYGEIVEHVRRYSLSINRRDALTAAIAKANGLVVACRNEIPFISAGVTVMKPWGI